MKLFDPENQAGRSGIATTAAASPGARMDDALLQLAQWLSPAFPVGGFAYSHGLEWAIDAGEVRDCGDLEAWLACVIGDGAGRTDASLLVAAMARDADHEALAGLARALCPAAERWVETRDQGTAFVAAINAATGSGDPPGPLPVAVGRAAGRLDLPPRLVAAQYLQAFLGNLALVAVRYVPLAAAEGQRIVAALRPLVLEIAALAQEVPPERATTSALGTEFAAMRHERMETRVFRT